MFIRDKPQLAHMIRKSRETPVMHPTAQPTAYSHVPATMVESMALKHSMASSMHASVTSRLAGMSFPAKVHYLLCHGIYDLGLEGIMRWQPGGHAFAIYSSEEFEMQGLAEYVSLAIDLATSSRDIMSANFLLSVCSLGCLGRQVMLHSELNSSSMASSVSEVTVSSPIVSLLLDSTNQH